MLSAWKRWRAKVAANRLSLQISDDVEFRARYTPELIGMSDVEAMAHTLQQADLWKAECSPDQLLDFRRLAESIHTTWASSGLTMPYWGTLWALRSVQKAHGLNVPEVAANSLNDLLP